MTSETSADMGIVDQTKDEADHLAHEAKVRGGEVVGEAKEEIRHLVDDVRASLRSQADDQAQRAAAALRGVSNQLGSMADGATEEGPMVHMARDGANRIERFADHVDEAGIDGVVHDIEDFARRRPGVFLAAGVAVGVLLGRMLRASDTTGIREGLTRGSVGRDDQRSMGDTAGFQAGAVETYPSRPEGVTPGDLENAGYQI